MGYKSDVCRSSEASSLMRSAQLGTSGTRVGGLAAAMAALYMKVVAMVVAVACVSWAGAAATASAMEEMVSATDPVRAAAGSATRPAAAAAVQTAVAMAAMTETGSEPSSRLQ